MTREEPWLFGPSPGRYPGSLRAYTLLNSSLDNCTHRTDDLYDLYDLYDMYDLAHAAGWEPHNLHDLGQLACVGSTL